MQKTIYTAAVILTLIVLILAAFGIAHADSPAVKCPAETSALFYMGEDESACYYKHELPRNNGYEVITIYK